jgi:hypothetical protein
MEQNIKLNNLINQYLEKNNVISNLEKEQTKIT